MLVHEAIAELARYNDVLARTIPGVSCRVLETPQVGFAHWFKEWPDSPSIRSSGVYLLNAPETGHILYIGKADRAKFGARVWEKFGKPVGGSEGHPQFPNSPLLKPYYRRGTPHHANILTGDINVTLLEVAPAWCTSLFEVYLQTICFSQEEELPPFNLRIG